MSIILFSGVTASAAAAVVTAVDAAAVVVVVAVADLEYYFSLPLFSLSTFLSSSVVYREFAWTFLWD